MDEKATERSEASLPLRLILRAPILLYRVGLADRLAERGLLLLHTIGRRSGRQRVSALNYGRQGTTVYVAAGWGGRTGWLRNLIANPLVEVEIGRRQAFARARVVTAPDEKQQGCGMLAAVDMGPPEPLRPMLRRFGFDYEAERAKAFADPASITLVALELAERIESAERAGARRSRAIPLVSAAAVVAALIVALAVRARRRSRIPAVESR